jgi:hypothetical protein
LALGALSERSSTFGAGKEFRPLEIVGCNKAIFGSRTRIIDALLYESEK